VEDAAIEPTNKPTYSPTNPPERYWLADRVKDASCGPCAWLLCSKGCMRSHGSVTESRKRPAAVRQLLLCRPPLKQRQEKLAKAR